MKRVTFVFVGIVIIVISTLLSQKHFEDTSSKVVKTDITKHELKSIYD
ncbi:hypothetical protein [uncultured Lacinutrix sp.]|nr:hypothetical protein [uncultured Lacinutrix sp.]